MDLKELTRRARELPRPYRVTKGRKFRLEAIDPDDTQDLKSEDKPRAKEMLRAGVEALARYQEMLYAQDRWAVLLIFQAMDATGKDGAIMQEELGDQDTVAGQVAFEAADVLEVLRSRRA